ncbi:MAG: response regulator transcription factor [Ferruginibacter sp.]|nr:response regulator transcription factor [Ferruginibacter sp.]
MTIKIAIVDDKLIVRRAIRDKLNSSPEMKIILEASNGEDFLDKLKQTEQDDLPEVVLIDLEMPLMDGIQSIAVASMLYSKMKFIVLTIFDNNEKIFEAIKAGANGYLLKDDDAVNLNEAILNVINYDAVPMSPAIARKTLSLLKTAVQETGTNTISSGLTTREHGVLQYLVEGFEYKQIAEKLFISPATVRTHIAHIYQKLHVTSKAQAIKLAYKNKWL